MLLIVSEKASIDESYLDLTSNVKEKLLADYPVLAKVPEGSTLDSQLPSPASLGISSLDWASVGNVIPLNPPITPESPGREDGASSSTIAAPLLEAQLAEEEPALTWNDVSLWIGAGIVNECRRKVETSLGYTCSAGIAPNKVSLDYRNLGLA